MVESPRLRDGLRDMVRLAGRRGLNWLFRRPRRTLGVAGGLLGAVFVAGAVFHAGAPTRPATALGAVSKSPTPTVVVPSPTVTTPLPAASTTPTAAAVGVVAAPAAALRVAQLFVASWAHHAGMTHTAWMQRLAAYTTPDLQAGFAATDLARIPAITTAGLARALVVNDGQADVAVPTNVGAVVVTLIDTPVRGWRVSSILPPGA